MPDLFVYGTLKDPAVLSAEIGRTYSGQCYPARLRGYRVTVLDGWTVPVILADPSAVTPGLLITALTDADFTALDAYEEIDTGAYARLLVQVEVDRESGAAVETAFVYAAGPAVSGGVRWIGQ
jgi:gamma-glutamylcyclotransferase (GGCT)/AIG2-like uncharacterized protein YtfP